MTSESQVDLMQPWINLLWVIQFQPNFQDNSYHDWKITIWSLEGVTSLILLPCPFFSKFALACKRHTVFFINVQPPQPRGFQEFFSDWFTIHKKIDFQHISLQKVCIWIIKLEFWGQIIWGPWSIWMKNDLK